MSVNFGPGFHVACGQRVDRTAYDRDRARWRRWHFPGSAPPVLRVGGRGSSRAAVRYGRLSRDQRDAGDAREQLRVFRRLLGPHRGRSRQPATSLSRASRPQPPRRTGGGAGTPGGIRGQGATSDDRRNADRGRARVDCRMRKVAVFGNAGGGKSTLARRLAEVTQLRLYPLDTIQFKAGGGEVPHAEYLKAHEELLSRDVWIIDGFGCVASAWERFSAADTLIYVDLPLFTHYRWVTKRLFKGLFMDPAGWPEIVPCGAAP